MKDQSLADPARRAFFLRAEVTRLLKVSLTERCFATAGVYCESCRDSCEAGAIQFLRQPGGVSRPFFDPSLCTQCGECASVCPRDAINISPIEVSHG